MNSDSDGDGLSDGKEINLEQILIFLIPMAMEYRTEKMPFLLTLKKVKTPIMMV